MPEEDSEDDNDEEDQGEVSDNELRLEQDLEYLPSLLSSKHDTDLCCLVVYLSIRF